MSYLSGGSNDIHKRLVTYVMAQVLLVAHQAPIPRELLHTMMAKVLCRLSKVEGLRSGFRLSMTLYQQLRNI